MKYTKEYLEQYVKQSTHMNDLLRKLYGPKVHGEYYARIKNKIRKWEIDTSHWQTPESVRFNKPLHKDEVFCLSDKKRQGAVLKTWMLKENIPYQCKICLIDNWCHKQLTLQVDHINGNNLDNRLENLRFLCPNCHSQTDTFCGRNQIKKVIVCQNCQLPIKSSKNKWCKKCVYKCKRKPTKDIIPDKPTLTNMLEKHRIIEVAKKFNVDKRTVVSWCKDMDIKWPMYPNGFWVEKENRQRFYCMFCQNTVEDCECFDVEP